MRERFENFDVDALIAVAADDPDERPKRLDRLTAFADQFAHIPFTDLNGEENPQIICATVDFELIAVFDQRLQYVLEECKTRNGACRLCRHRQSLNLPGRLCTELVMRCHAAASAGFASSGFASGAASVATGVGVAAGAPAGGADCAFFETCFA